MPYGYNPFVRRGADQWTCRSCEKWCDEDQDACDECGTRYGENSPPADDMDEAA